MTEQELDRLMQRVLLDAVKLDCAADSGRVPAFEPTENYQRQMKAMLADPLKWARRRARPMWKRVLQKAAMILLMFTLGLGSLMAVSPTVRATVVRWAVEWYETHITYRFSGEQISGEMPRYEITELPEGYAEVESERVEWPSYVSVIYQDQNDENAQWIYLRYVYMQQGTLSDFETEDADIVPVTVNGAKGQLYLARNPEQSDSTVTWIDPDQNLLFAIDAALDADSILHMAESVSLVKSKRQMAEKN